MATETNIEHTHRGEPLVIVLAAKDPDGSVISSPGSQTVTVTIGTSPSADPTLEFNDSPQVTLSDVGAGEFTIVLTESDLSSLTENTQYFYNIWSRLVGGEPYLQAKGRLRRLSSIETS